MQHSNYLLIQSTYWYNEGMFLVCFHHWQAQGKRNLRDGGLTLASNFRVWQEGNNRIKPRCIHPSEPHLLLFSPPLNNVRKFCIHQWICPFMRSDDPIILQSPVSEHCFYYIYYMVKPSTHMPSGRILYTEMVTKGLETSFQNFSFQQKVLKYTSKCLQALGGGGGETGGWV